MLIPRRTFPFRFAVAAAALAILTGLSALDSRTSAATPSLGELHSELGQQQARQQSLSASIGALSHQISSLDAQISFVRNREAAVSQELASDRAQLTRVHAALTAEQIRLAKLKRRLAVAKGILARQLVAGYESSRPDVITVILNSSGFNQLLEQLNFLGRAQHQQQTIISITRAAKAAATASAQRLAKLEQTDRQIAAATEIKARELTGMNELLQSRQAAVSRAQAAQQSALAVSQAISHRLRRQISQVQAAQAAAAARAAAAAAAAAQQAANSSPVAVGPNGGSGGWAIPYAIVLCESGGQNLPPNSVGASGYYQIVPSTWKLFGGTGPAAYLAGKAEQDAVAARIWGGGAGASNWVCAGIVGIH